MASNLLSGTEDIKENTTVAVALLKRAFRSLCIRLRSLGSDIAQDRGPIRESSKQLVSQVVRIERAREIHRSSMTPFVVAADSSPIVEKLVQELDELGALVVHELIAPLESMSQEKIEPEPVSIGHAAPTLVVAIDDLLLRAEAALRKAETYGEHPSAGSPQKYQSAFISYGGPDESFATLLDERLADAGVDTFLFCKDAVPGRKLHTTMGDGVNAFDRVILICSENSLDRAGVLNEVEKVLERESREGGREIMIPISVDDHVYTSWSVPGRDYLRREILDRVVGDFKNSLENGLPNENFSAAIDRLLTALRNDS